MNTERSNLLGIGLEAANALIDQIIASGVEKDVEAAILQVGTLIDLSGDLRRVDGIEAAITNGEALLQLDLSATQRATLHYFLANAYEDKRRFSRNEDKLYEWAQPEFEKQIIHLRRALSASEGTDLPRGRVCQILTNLGNLMSHCGRIVDAIGYWDRALGLAPDFDMAIGNRAAGLERYARVIHDPGHQVFHLREARRGLTLALSDELARNLTPDARAFFEAYLKNLNEKVDPRVFEPITHEHKFDAEMSSEELRYRKWCLKQRLFLNDLNDLGEDPYAAADVLTLPSIVTPLVAPMPNAYGFFNQMKQEYVSARFFFFFATETFFEPHWSDRQVTLINTGDYPAYGLGVEQRKMAFRVAYSLLDKVGYFINDYFELGIPEKNVSFRGVWFNAQTPKEGLREELRRRTNSPLQGLYWLAKDLFEKDKAFAEALEPDARELAEIRNHLEHKYLKLHIYGPPDRDVEPLFQRGEALAYSVALKEFERKTLHLFRLARAALIYLSLAVHVEEHAKGKQWKGQGIGAPIPMDVWEDDWKI